LSIDDDLILTFGLPVSLSRTGHTGVISWINPHLSVRGEEEWMKDRTSPRRVDP
jgi:hypothetical protein